MKHAAALSLALCLSLPLAALPHPAQARQAIADAPALAAAGAYPIGVAHLTLIHPNQPDLLASDLAAGTLARADRPLPVTLWYPAVKPAVGSALARYAMPAEPAAGVAPTMVPYKVGGAYDDAAPVRGQGFPLVVISPGYRNWAASFSDLAENLASKGYVVAVIDHHDLEPVTLKTPQLSFATTVITRVADQRFVIAELTRRADQGLLKGVYDPSNIALIGYSMGGFGALATLGAGFDPDSALYKQVPGGLLRGFTLQNPGFDAGRPKGVKALVAFAPWGGAPPLRAWSAAGLARITTPSLVVVGDQDDVSGYVDGVAWIYEAMTGAERHLLVYENARHNIARDGVPPTLAGGFASVERYEEPVWRRDRILAINRHFVTAFLDAQLKGDQTHGDYLNVPTVKAAEGGWPGFQKRWALGLRLRHDAPSAAR